MAIEQTLMRVLSAKDVPFGDVIKKLRISIKDASWTIKNEVLSKDPFGQPASYKVTLVGNAVQCSVYIAPSDRRLVVDLLLKFTNSDTLRSLESAFNRALGEALGAVKSADFSFSTKGADLQEGSVLTSEKRALDQARQSLLSLDKEVRSEAAWFEIAAEEVASIRSLFK